MELTIRTRGQYDALEILFSETFSEEIQRQLIDRIEIVRGVETGASARYSMDIAVAPHVATIEVIVTDILKIFEEPEVRTSLKAFGITKIRVIRSDGTWEFRSMRDKTSEV